MRKQPIFVAVDTSNIKRAKQIVNATNKYIYGVKFGLEFFCSKQGRLAIKQFQNKNVNIFSAYFLYLCSFVQNMDDLQSNNFIIKMLKYF